MSESAILAAARAAVAAALPGAKDWSDDPADPKVGRLDVFVVTLTRDDATPAAMGSDLEECQLTLEVEVFTKYRPADDGRAQATTLGAQVKDALLSDPAIRALVDFQRAIGLEVDLAKGEERLARATVQHEILATF